jgi:hypothetical protein
VKFKTHVTEADFVAAHRLQRKSWHRVMAGAIAYSLGAVFWLFLICAAVSEWTHPGGMFLDRNASEFVRLLFPGAILLLLWILAFRVYPPFATRRKFRQTHTLHGEILNEITAEGLWQKTAGGSFGFSQWHDFSHWRESEEIIIVVYPSDVFCLLPKSGLSLDQCDELRHIIAATLPQK